MIWFELRGQFAPQSLHLGTKSEHGVTTACGGRWSHGEDFVAVPRRDLLGKRLCGACFKIDGGESMSKFANVYELLAESKKTQRIVQQKYPDGWSTLHYLASAKLGELEAWFAAGEIRIKPDMVTVLCWKNAHLVEEILILGSGQYQSREECETALDLTKAAHPHLKNTSSKAIQVTVKFEVDECV